MKVKIFPFILSSTPVKNFFKKLHLGGTGFKTCALNPSLPKNLRPAEVGVLIEEKVEAKQLAATIIDFAVRGFLKIKEEKKSFWHARDYFLIKIKEVDGGLKKYEKMLFNLLFKDKKEIRLSKVAREIAEEQPKIKKMIYEGLISAGYFSYNPERFMRSYLLIGTGFITAGMAMGLLFSFTLGVAFLMSGLLFVFFTKFISCRTPKGFEAFQRALGFKELISNPEKSFQVAPAKEEHLSGVFLPYTLILGLTKKWLKVFSSDYQRPPSWYQGDWLAFNPAVFTASLKNFENNFSHLIEVETRPGGLLRREGRQGA